MEPSILDYYQEFPQKIMEWLEANGQTSQIVELRTMLTSNKNSKLKRRLVELKAVDTNWPLKGNAVTLPNQSLQEMFVDNNDIHGVLIDKSLKKQLKSLQSEYKDDISINKMKSMTDTVIRRIYNEPSKILNK